MADKPGLVEQLALRYISSVVQQNVHPADEPYVLNAAELRTIRIVTIQTLLAAAILGTLGVLCLYLPQYWFPMWFPKTAIRISGTVYKIEIVSTIYGILLIWPELWGLNYFNLRAVRLISAACMFPRPDSANAEKNIRALVDAGLETQRKDLSRFKIDPYLGMSGFWYWTLLLVSRFKATLSNLLVKLVLKRILGRFALKQVADLAGIPVFAFWNARASYEVIRETKVRVMAPLAIAGFVKQLKLSAADQNALKQYLPAVLQMAASLKRKYNYAIYLLAESLDEAYGLDMNLTTLNLAALDTADEETQNAMAQVLVCCMVIDGELSRREIKGINSLQTVGWFSYKSDMVRQIGEKYWQGRGLQFS